MKPRQMELSPELVARYTAPTTHRPLRTITVKILIVCEGTKTEPAYFKHFAKHNRGTIVYDIDVKGMGRNTTQVVDKAIELRDKAKNTPQEYDRVWAVFDKDDFPDKLFHDAIHKATRNDIMCAWSNEAFELWYLYHFQDRTTPMSRKEYERAISMAVNKAPNYKENTKYKYEKNNPQNYIIMTTYGSQANAIRFAERQSKSFTDQKYATHNPCTMVYKLVQQLIGQDKKLNAELARKI